VTSGCFFKLLEQIRKWQTTEGEQVMERFNGILYGLGPSVNEDIYIEEYKALAIEYSNGSGKLTNLNTIAGHTHLPQHDSYSASNGSTASSSSTNSQVLAGMSATQNQLLIN
jgi:hypothetical protein